LEKLRFKANYFPYDQEKHEFICRHKNAGSTRRPELTNPKMATSLNAGFTNGWSVPPARSNPKAIAVSRSVLNYNATASKPKIICSLSKVLPYDNGAVVSRKPFSGTSNTIGASAVLCSGD
jgi:hypothetical protein